MKNVPSLRFSGFSDEWEEQTLGKIAEIVGGGTPSTSVPEYWDGSIDWYAPAEMKDQRFAADSVRKITELGLQNCSAKILPADKTVLFTSRAGIGKTAILKKPGATNQGFQSLVLNDDINPYFVYSKSTEIKEKAEQVASGSTFLEISGKMLSELTTNLPKKDEQDLIAETFEKLDDIIVARQQKYEKLVALKSACLDKMFPKVGDDIPELRLGKFDVAWEWHKIGNLTKVLSASRVHKGDWKTEGVPFFRSSDVISAYKGTENTKAFISMELYEELAKSSGKLEENDILITGGGSIGIPYIVPNNEPLYSKDADLIWIKTSPKFDSKFLYAYFACGMFKDYLRSISHVGTIAHYTIEQVKDTPVMLPDVSEQKMIGGFFFELDNLINMHKCKVEKLKQLKQAMLNNMFV